MAINSIRNRLQNDGLIFRELEVGENTGFVLRVMDRDVKPPKVTTVVQQPGQDTITTESLLFSEERIVFPIDGGHARFASPTPTRAENPNRIIELLQSNYNYIAKTALQHLLTFPEFSE